MTQICTHNPFNYKAQKHLSFQARYEDLKLLFSKGENSLQKTKKKLETYEGSIFSK